MMVIRKCESQNLSFIINSSFNPSAFWWEIVTTKSGLPILFSYDDDVLVTDEVEDYVIYFSESS